MSWIIDELDSAAQEWDAQCELTKPLISAPYFAMRADACDCARCAA